MSVPSEENVAGSRRRRAHVLEARERPPARRAPVDRRLLAEPLVDHGQVRLEVGRRRVVREAIAHAPPAARGWIWGGRGDLNPRPSEPQSDALTN